MNRPANIKEIETSAADMLRRGDAGNARKLYEQIVAQGAPTSSAWLGLAQACRALDDQAASLAAIDKAIALDPRNVLALLQKADHYSRAGNDKAASSFYSAALRQASTLERVSPELIDQLRHAKAMLERYAKSYEDHLWSALASRGIDKTRSSNRFRQSLDLILGKKQVYWQQPSQYFFPELPQIQFYEREEFPWLASIEAATEDIRNELVEVLKEEDAFRPYVERVPNRPPPDDASMVGNPNWSAYFLWKDGAPVPEHVARCPKTMRAMESAPLCRIARRAPSVLFSLLRPGTKIPPHTGTINTRLICHLPLIVPDKCLFRVGNDVRAWERGKTILFDDTMEHEARNDSAETRVVLIFDIWRPELTAEERELVAATLEAIDSYGTA